MPNHYQQERGDSAKFETHKEAEAVKVKVESKLGNASGGIRGWCINNWKFRRDSPLITCLAKIGGADKTTSLNLFKKYICFRPGFYTHWAYKMDGEVYSGSLGLKPVEKPFKKYGVGYGISLPAKWVTLFNKTQGFALVSLGERGACNPLNLNIWQSRTMEELLYTCRSGERTMSLTLGYLAYARAHCAEFSFKVLFPLRCQALPIRRGSRRALSLRFR